MHVIDVPFELTRGSATQVVGGAHCVIWNLPPTHCAKPLLTQASSPSNKTHVSDGIVIICRIKKSPLHEELVVSVENFAFNF